MCDAIHVSHMMGIQLVEADLNKDPAEGLADEKDYDGDFVINSRLRLIELTSALSFLSEVKWINKLCSLERETESILYNCSHSNERKKEITKSY